MLLACKSSAPPGPESVPGCEPATTAIAEIQGDQSFSPLVGSEVTIGGIVTRLDDGSGFTLEEPGSDHSPLTSNGIYVEDQFFSGEVKTGQRWLITGQVSERGSKQDTLTTLSAVSHRLLCASGSDLPISRLILPLDSRQREAIESMRVSFRQSLNVADVYGFYRGEVLLSSIHPLRVPTEDAFPGDSAGRLRQSNREHSIQTLLDPSDKALVHRGSRLRQAYGVMGHNGNSQVLFFEGDLRAVSPPPPGLADAGPGITRVVNMNLLNYFNGDGTGHGFPGERGAKSFADFTAQANRIQSALSALQPGILAVQELENDGFGPHSAARSLLKLLEAAVPGDWAVVKTNSGKIGTDHITVGVFYRADLLAALGSPGVLDSAPFRGLSRQPLAQLFRDRASGVTFLLVANHLKSKGSCPESGRNSDQGDGQGCWNPMRVEAAAAVAEWAIQRARTAGTEHVIILGDMNAYRNEDPIQAFRQLDFTELVEHYSGLPQYSYVYRGESGTLDYIFTTGSVLDFVRHAEIWHVNSGWPQKTDLPQPWLRFSDHDPVLLDLDFSQAATSD